MSQLYIDTLVFFPIYLFCHQQMAKNELFSTFCNFEEKEFLFEMYFFTKKKNKIENWNENFNRKISIVSYNDLDIPLFTIMI